MAAANIEEIKARWGGVPDLHFNDESSTRAYLGSAKDAHLLRVDHPSREEVALLQVLAHAPTDIANLIHDLNGLRHIEGTVQRVFDANDQLKAQLAACRAELQAAQELAELRHAEREQALEDKQVSIRVANQLEQEMETTRRVRDSAIANANRAWAEAEKFEHELVAARAEIEAHRRGAE